MQKIDQVEEGQASCMQLCGWDQAAIVPYTEHRHERQRQVVLSSRSLGSAVLLLMCFLIHATTEDLLAEGQFSFI